jgi:hypothetical protein
MTNPIDTAYDRAQAAIKALADAGHRAAHEHAHALDLLRAQVESLRAINANLRHKCEAQEVGLVNLRRSDQDLRLERAALRERLADLEHRVTHTAEVLAMPVDTENPAQPWTPKFGDRVRIARPPRNRIVDPDQWYAIGDLARVGDVGTIARTRSDGDVDLGHVDGGRYCGVIDPSCLDLVLP